MKICRFDGDRLGLVGPADGVARQFTDRRNDPEADFAGIGRMDVAVREHH
ncbi:MAG: hypothetical protein HOM58_01120 [Rhodospirillaceae bacterium]|nr:hypothetical protein [Rhodospirillaceae bacterium]MBT5455539.1 hypothetical protein [Rhodospirillaceae bacterium]